MTFSPIVDCYLSHSDQSWREFPPVGFRACSRFLLISKCLSLLRIPGGSAGRVNAEQLGRPQACRREGGWGLELYFCLNPEHVIGQQQPSVHESCLKINDITLVHVRVVTHSSFCDKGHAGTFLEDNNKHLNRLIDHRREFSFPHINIFVAWSKTLRANTDWI